ncbi:MAG TPA: phosphoenolpyruvate--protein phosphotransferase [Desulfobacteraceae bacterium]|nr:phosphoenolpyruvate--protein phosphotransferase [Deltaproteobacteria bacterium]HDI59792.1 phosphoenolpyruvate--protein phosphotransferase [Desulfobacteraceae bacterium]
MISTETGSEQRFYGIAASPGICIGKAYLVNREGVQVVQKYELSPDEISHETSRFRAAVKKADDELNAVIANTSEELKQNSAILEAHKVLLKDKLLYGKVLSTIESEQVNAEWALKKVVTEINAIFSRMTDAYFRERADDINHVADRILRNLIGGQHKSIGTIDKRVILVARDLSPADTSQIQLERIKGFITDKGGRTSHTSIIARTLEIPAVLGLHDATRNIRNDDIVIVDGTAGVVIVHPTEQTLLTYEERREHYEGYKAQIRRRSHLPAETRDGVHVRILGNIELTEEVVSVLDHGGDGIGLYRTEFQYMNRKEFPDEFELYDKYRDVVEVMGEKPVTIRTLDINGDKAVAFTPENHESNPALGLRAIRYCLKKPDIFKTQLRAILRAAAHGNVRVLFPMISGVEEIVAARRLLDEAALELSRADVPHNRDIPVGIMVEVPSAVIMADALVRQVDFFSIGTNDLIQYTMAIDRGNQNVAHLFHPLHPALIRMVHRVTQIGLEAGIGVDMCGEMAADPLHVPLLLGLGLTELSMAPASIPAIKRMVRLVSAADGQALLQDILRLEKVRDVVHLVDETYGQLVAQKVYGDMGSAR